MSNPVGSVPYEQMTAADVMTPSPRTCSGFSSVLEAVMIFRDLDCGAVPIIADGKPVAILTDRDVALAIAEHPDLVNRPVKGIMVPGVVAVAPDDSLDQVCGALRAQGVRRVLVVDPAARRNRNHRLGRYRTSAVGPPDGADRQGCDRRRLDDFTRVGGRE